MRVYWLFTEISRNDTYRLPNAKHNELDGSDDYYDTSTRYSAGGAVSSRIFSDIQLDLRGWKGLDIETPRAKVGHEG